MPVKVWVEGDPHHKPTWEFPRGNEVSVNSLGLIVSRQREGAFTKTLAGIRDWVAFSVEGGGDGTPDPQEETVPAESAEPVPEEETSETSEDAEPIADTPSADEQQSAEEAPHGKRK